MNRTALIITLVIVGLVAGGIWTYDRYFNRPEGTLWDLVPESASLVYEPQNGLDIISAINETTLWESLTGEESFGFIKSNLSQLDSLVPRDKVNRMIRDGGLLIVINPVSGTDFDYLYILDKKRNPKVLESFIAELNKSSTKAAAERIYNGYTINEIPLEARDFSYAMNEDYWWGSYSSFLTEDVIRRLTEDGTRSFQAANPEPFFNTKIAQDAGNLYFNYDQLGVLLNSFVAPQSRRLSAGLGKVGKSAFLDLDIKDDLILLTGFSYYENEDFLKSLEAKPSGTSNIKLYIPSQTAYYINYFSEEFNATEVDKEWLNTLSGEVAYAVMEGISLTESEKLVFLRSNEPDETSRLLLQLAQDAVNSLDDTLYYEDFSDSRILEMRNPEFLPSLTPYFKDQSDRYFYTVTDNLVVLSSSIQTIKNWLIDMDTENTWGKSIKKNSFYENTLKESSFSIYFDVNRSWDYILENLHIYWGDHFEVMGDTYRNFDLLAIQFSYTDKKFFTSLAMSYNADNSSILTRRRRLDPDLSVELNSPVQLKPKVVRNHRTPSLEVIIQDNENELYLISPQRGVLWSKTLSSDIRGEITQVDFYRNDKLQYAFATDSAIHVIDRDGNYVEGFPSKLPYKIDRFNIIDYDNTKRYRFATSDLRGNVYLYDQQVNDLNGWSPRALQGRLAIAPFHFRVRGRDIIVAVQEKGRVNLMNRRGEMLPGFPIDLGPNLRPVFHREIGSSFSSTVLTFITKDGLLYKYDLNGKRINSQQLFRSSRNVQFDIVPEYSNKGYILVNKDIGYFQVMDKSGNEIFRSNIISTRPFNYQYYDFGSDRKLYVVTDEEQEFSYLYNRNGDLINNSPINSKFDIGVIFSEKNNEYKIYTAYENKISIYSF